MLAHQADGKRFEAAAAGGKVGEVHGGCRDTRAGAPGHLVYGEKIRCPTGGCHDT
jgi:hypothetical protein